MGNFPSSAIAVNNYELATTSVPLYMGSYNLLQVLPALDLHAPEVKHLEYENKIPLGIESYLKPDTNKPGSTWDEPKVAKRLSFLPAKKLDLLQPEHKEVDHKHDSQIFLQQKSCLIDQQKQLRKQLRQPVKRAFYKISTM